MLNETIGESCNESIITKDKHLMLLKKLYIAGRTCSGYQNARTEKNFIVDEVDKLMYFKALGHYFFKIYLKSLKKKLKWRMLRKYGCNFENQHFYFLAVFFLCFFETVQTSTCVWYEKIASILLENSETIITAINASFLWAKISEFKPCLNQGWGDLSMLISIGLYVFNVVCAARLAICRIALVR